MWAVILLALDVSSDPLSILLSAGPKRILVHKLSDGRVEEQRVAGREKIGDVTCTVIDTWYLHRPERIRNFVSVSRDGLRYHKMQSGSGQHLEIKPPLHFARTPFRQNARWTQDVELHYQGIPQSYSARVTFQTLRYERIRVPAGEFRCVVVQTTWVLLQDAGSKMIDTMWYSPGIGLIKETVVQQQPGWSEEKSAVLQEIR